MRSLRPIRLLTLTIAVLLLVQTAVLADSLVRRGGTVSAVATVASSTGAQTGYTSGYVAVPGSFVTIDVPAGKRELLVITFSAQSSCNGGDYMYCMLRIAVDGTVTDDIVFDSVPDGVAWEAHSFQWVVPVGPGSHVVRAQYRADTPEGYFTMTAYTMTVLRSNR